MKPICHFLTITVMSCAFTLAQESSAPSGNEGEAVTDSKEVVSSKEATATKEVTPSVQVTPSEEITVTQDADEPLNVSEVKQGKLYVLPVGDPPAIYRSATPNKQGIHLQIDPLPGDTVPFSVTLSKNANLPGDDQPQELTLTRNNITQSLKVTLTEEGSRLIFKAPKKKKPAFKSFSWPVKLPDAGDYLLLVTPQNQLKKPWATPLIDLISCSNEAVPPGAALIYNFSSYPVTIKYQSQLITLEPRDQHIIQAKEIATAPLAVKVIKGKTKIYLYNRPLKQDSDRKIFVVYDSPQSNAAVKVNICVDSLPSH